MKKSRLLLLLFLLPALILLGFQLQESNQNTESKPRPYQQKGNLQWYKMKADARVTISEFLLQHQESLGLTDNQRWIRYRTETDQLNITHNRYQLHHAGIPVEGAELLIHEKNGIISSFNGCWTPNMQAELSVSLSEEDAIEKALHYIPAEQYMWENHGAEKLVKMVERSTIATSYPQPELVLFNNTFPKTKGAFRAAYKMIIEATKPITRKLVFIDASTGELLEQLELLHTTDTPATAVTKYHGTRQITTDSIAPDSFRLRESSRGLGISTLDYNQNDTLTNYQDFAVDFWDTDNYWDTQNDEQDEVAHDVHFGSEMTFDFLRDHLDHTGIFVDSIPMVSLVHFGSNVVNAFWNGRFCSFGDGNNNQYSPLTSIDVVGHEFAHGLTQTTADLIYRNEPGGLNESFSDIIGTAVEYWAEPDSMFDYFIGEDFDNSGTGFRDMSNPNAEGHPDTYLGNNWVFGPEDNGGVHSNSGVQNYWFYLLTEGGSGTNDNGYQYNVEGLGMDTSTLIAYRNLRYYLTRFSQFIDARQGARTSAEDLYGPCSFAAQQTVNAWRAVGVGPISDDNDFEMISFIGLDSLNCGLSPEENPTIQMRYNGCLAPLGDNSLVPLEIVVDNGDIQRDTILLANGILGGDTLTYTIDTPISGLETMGLHNITVSVAFPGDTIANNNNTISFDLENILDQNADFRGDQFLRPLPDCFMSLVPIEIEVTFLGCDLIESGSELFFSYAFDGNIVTESSILTTDYSRGESLTYTFNEQLNVSTYRGFSDITAWVEFPDDFIMFNDSTFAEILNPELLIVDKFMTFDSMETQLDSIHIYKTDYSDVSISELASFESDYGIFMTGKDPNALNDNDILEFVSTPASVWQFNEELSAMFCVCVDAQFYNSMELSFDLRQVRSSFLEDAFEIPTIFSSALRVLVNGEQASPTYTTDISSGIGDWSRQYLDISDYSGDLLEICFESRCVASLQVSSPGDRVYIDNVLLSGVVSTENSSNNQYALNINPNPSDGQFVVNYKSNTTESLTMAIFDIHGRQLWTQETSGGTAQGALSIDLSAFAEGLYFLRIGDGKNFVNERIVVAR